MGSFTFSEILTIILVILIVFGPNRLPELARKTGEWVARARRAAVTMREEFVTEYGDAIEPLKEARDEIRTTGEQLRGELKAVTDDVKAAGDGVKEAAEDLVPDDEEPDDEGDAPPTAEESA